MTLFIFQGYGLLHQVKENVSCACHFISPPKGVQILCFSSFLQSFQPYGFKIIVLFVNQIVPKNARI